MTTLADLTYMVAKETGDVLEGQASTGGSATTLEDTAMLTQPAGFWKGGTVWLLSGTHSGKYAKVSDFGSKTLTFATLGSTPHPCRYFQDGRPRGSSDAWFQDADVFTAADLLRHLRYPNGRLQLEVDYLRGRCIKTEVDVWPDGRIRLETVNRGQAATRWVDRLRGKRVLTLVKGP